MTAPLIGITIHPATSPDRHELDVLVSLIVRSVERAGGLPLLIPLEIAETTLDSIIARLDGLLLSGGGDLDSLRYGEVPHPKLGGVDAERDRVELALVQQALAQQLPLFGICRGAQTLNVALGGSLYQDISSELPQAQRHAYYPDLPFDLRPHPIQIAEDSRLAQILGVPLLEVNSLHHQALKTIAPGLRVTATAPDGVVEAIELPDQPFCLAVQWHPEALIGAPDADALFRAFVDACRS